MPDAFELFGRIQQTFVFQVDDHSTLFGVNVKIDFLRHCTIQEYYLSQRHAPEANELTSSPLSMTDILLPQQSIGNSSGRSAAAHVPHNDLRVLEEDIVIAFA